jgi:hypothetical protein
MALTIVDFDEKEELILKNLKNKLKLNKPQIIKKIVREAGISNG